MHGSLVIWNLRSCENTLLKGHKINNKLISNKKKTKFNKISGHVCFYTKNECIYPLNMSKHKSTYIMHVEDNDDNNIVWKIPEKIFIVIIYKCYETSIIRSLIHIMWNWNCIALAKQFFLDFLCSWKWQIITSISTDERIVIHNNDTDERKSFDMLATIRRKNPKNFIIRSTANHKEQKIHCFENKMKHILYNIQIQIHKTLNLTLNQVYLKRQNSKTLAVFWNNELNSAYSFEKLRDFRFSIWLSSLFALCNGSSIRENSIWYIVYIFINTTFETTNQKLKKNNKFNTHIQQIFIIKINNEIWLCSRLTSFAL